VTTLEGRGAWRSECSITGMMSGGRVAVKSLETDEEGMGNGGGHGGGGAGRAAAKPVLRIERPLSIGQRPAPGQPGERRPRRLLGGHQRPTVVQHRPADSRSRRGPAPRGLERSPPVNEWRKEPAAAGARPMRARSHGAQPSGDSAGQRGERAEIRCRPGGTGTENNGRRGAYLALAAARCINSGRGRIWFKPRMRS